MADEAEPKPERPAGCKYWVADDAVKWVTDNCQLEPDETPEDTILWWMANNYADQYREQNSREFAEMVLEGIPPLQMTEVTEYLQSRVEDIDIEAMGGIGVLDEQLENELRDFFGKRINQ